ncbi:hypothetical protein [Nocardioides sp. 503]|nr:hypothetical protein [Nocardioides sp. 503]
MKTMDKNDSLLIINVLNDDYAGWLPERAWEWIRKHIVGAYAR